MLNMFALEQDLVTRVINGWDDVDWYAEAKQWCQIVAGRYGMTTAQVAGIVAALSPQRKWDINLRQTVEFIESHGTEYLHYGHQIHKAQAIYHGADPAEVLNGQKETCFYHNIMGDTDVVTIDRHMLTALGFGGKRLTKGRYEIADDTLGRLADGFGLAKPQVQAAIWSTLAY